MARRKPKDRDPREIMHPKTYMVDSPDWDPEAPDVEVDLSGEGKAKAAAGAGGPGAAPVGAGPAEGHGRLGLVIGLAVLGVAGAALALNFVLGRQTDQAVAEAEAAATEIELPEGASAAAALIPDGSAEEEYAELALLYRGHVAATAAALGVDAPSTEALQAPAVFHNPITHGKPRVIGPGASLREGPISLRVKVVQGLSVDRIKVSNKGQHTLLLVENRGEVPIAYHLLARKLAGSKCLTPAIIRYDALVLDPGQKVEISICSGRQSVEVIDLRTLELTPVGAAWVRQLPAAAVGLTGLTLKAHQVAEGTPQCTEDEEMLQRALYEDELAWEDVVDFYSRHDCTHYPWPSDYRFEDGQGPARLPVVAPWNPGMSPYDKPDEGKTAPSP